MKLITTFFTFEAVCHFLCWMHVLLMRLPARVVTKGAATERAGEVSLAQMFGLHMKLHSIFSLAHMITIWAGKQSVSVNISDVIPQK